MATKVAVIQKPPVLLNREKTIARTLESIEEAAREGASLLVFPEAYIPGYPTWIWRLKPGGDMALCNEIHARLRQNAVDLSANDLKPVQDAARKHGLTVVIGLHEIDSGFSGTTLFNTVVVIGPDGAILNRHRKLMPTNPERMVWGMGDATGLKVVDTPAGRLGSSSAGRAICRSRATRSMPRAWRFLSIRLGTMARPAWLPCGTSQRRGVYG